MLFDSNPYCQRAHVHRARVHQLLCRPEWYAITLFRMLSSVVSGRNPISAWIFEVSGTRRGMSSNPSSYAAVWGMCTISDSELVSLLMRSASAFIDTSSFDPML